MKEPEAWRAPLGDRIPNNPQFPVLLDRGVEAAAYRRRARLTRLGRLGLWGRGLCGRD